MFHTLSQIKEYQYIPIHKDLPSNGMRNINMAALLKRAKDMDAFM